MTRKLPWLSSQAKTPSPSVRSNPTPPQKRRRIQETVDGEPIPNTTCTHQQPTKPTKTAIQSPNQLRNLSSSPPPQSSLPPQTQLMRPGLDGDDAWIMVEDEFLSTAKRFTQHLHRLEYAKMKRSAKMQRGFAISEMYRPVDGRTQLSMESRKKMEGNVQRRLEEDGSVDNGVVRRDGDGHDGDGGDDAESEEDDPYKQDERLAGLMMTCKESSTPLLRIDGVKSKTRASEGYCQTADSPKQNEKNIRVDGDTLDERHSMSIFGVEHHSEDDEDDFDLDAPLPSPQASREKVELAKRSSRSLPERARKDVDLKKTNASFINPNEASKSSLKPPLEIFDDFPSSQRLISSGLAQRLAKRRAEEARKGVEENRRKSLLLAEIPTFLV